MEHLNFWLTKICVQKTPFELKCVKILTEWNKYFLKSNNELCLFSDAYLVWVDRANVRETFVIGIAKSVDKLFKNKYSLFDHSSNCQIFLLSTFLIITRYSPRRTNNPEYVCAIFKSFRKKLSNAFWNSDTSKCKILQKYATLQLLPLFYWI